MRPTTIVIVEDNEAIAQLVQDLLVEELSCEALVAGDGFSGLELIKKTRPDLVILDVGLPGLDGFQVHDFLREDRHLKFTPILILTASDYPASYFLERRIPHHIRKPFDLEDLLAHVERLLSREYTHFEPGMADSATAPLA